MCIKFVFCLFKAWKTRWCLTWSAKTWTFPLMWRSSSQRRSACLTTLKPGSSLWPSSKSVRDNEDEVKGLGFFRLPSLFEIKSLRWSLQSWWIDCIEAVCMCDIICILHIFMQRCAFLRALMLSFTVPQKKCAVHTCLKMWTLRIFFFIICSCFVLFSIFLSINMYRVSVQLKVFLLALDLSCEFICPKEAEKKSEFYSGTKYGITLGTSNWLYQV